VGFILLLASVVLLSVAGRVRRANAVAYILYDTENQSLTKAHAEDFARFLTDQHLPGTIHRLAFYRKNQPDARNHEIVFRHIAFKLISTDDNQAQAVDRRILRKIQWIVWAHPFQEVHVVLVTTDQDYEGAVKVLRFMNYRVSVWAKAFDGRTSELYQHAGAETLAFGSYLSPSPQHPTRR